eukprot:683734-Hanusia_phi.AAC.3
MHGDEQGRHSACRDCWETWLKEHNTCMLLKLSARFSDDLVSPEKDHDMKSSRDANACSDDVNYRLETVSNAFMRSLVDVKSRFDDVLVAVGLSSMITLLSPQVRGSLHEVMEHLSRKNMCLMHGDARLSVTSVEASSLLEQLKVPASSAGTCMTTWHRYSTPSCKVHQVLHIRDPLPSPCKKRRLDLVFGGDKKTRNAHSKQVRSSRTSTFTWTNVYKKKTDPTKPPRAQSTHRKSQ